VLFLICDDSYRPYILLKTFNRILTSNVETWCLALFLYLFQVRGRSDSPGPEFCPRIESVRSDLPQVLVASMSEVNVTIVVRHLQVQFSCIFCDIWWSSLS